VTKIKFGEQYDSSSTEYDIATSGNSKLDIAVGDMHDTSTSKRHITESQSKAEDAKSGELWVRVSIVLVVLAVLALPLIYGQLGVGIWAFPVSIVAAVLVCYGLGLVLLKDNPKLKSKDFLQVLKVFTSVAMGKSGAKPDTSNH